VHDGIVNQRPLREFVVLRRAKRDRRQDLVDEVRVRAVAYGFELRRAELERQVRRIRRQYVTELRTLTHTASVSDGRKIHVLTR
jgi:hypothetical protein